MRKRSGFTPSMRVRHFGAGLRRQHHEIERRKDLPHQLAVILVVIHHDNGAAWTGIGADRFFRRRRRVWPVDGG